MSQCTQFLRKLCWKKWRCCRSSCSSTCPTFLLPKLVQPFFSKSKQGHFWTNLQSADAQRSSSFYECIICYVRIWNRLFAVSQRPSPPFAHETKPTYLIDTPQTLETILICVPLSKVFKYFFRSIPNVLPLPELLAPLSERWSSRAVVQWSVPSVPSVRHIALCVLNSLIDSQTQTIWPQLASADLTWPQVTSLDLSWLHLISADLTWSQLTSTDLSRPQLT